jgi:catechol 2,3-dioxygenase-like lactoylglutathione lyase family enzyme
MSAQHILSIVLPVRDHERAKSYYTNVMGFDLVRDERQGPTHHRWIEVGPKGAETTISLVDAHLRQTRMPVEGLVLKVSDLAAFRSRLKANGARPSEIVKENWGLHFSLHDPDGNNWIVVELENAKADRAGRGKKS